MEVEPLHISFLTLVEHLINDVMWFFEQLENYSLLFLYVTKKGVLYHLSSVPLFEQLWL